VKNWWGAITGDDGIVLEKYFLTTFYSPER